MGHGSHSRRWHIGHGGMLRGHLTLRVFHVPKSFEYTKFVNKSCDIFLRWIAFVFLVPGAVWCWFILDSVWTLKGYAMAPHLQTCARFASLCYLKMKWMGASVSHVWRCFLEPAGLVRAFRGLCLSENQNWRAKLYRMQWQKDKLCNIVFIYVSKYCMYILEHLCIEQCFASRDTFNYQNRFECCWLHCWLVTKCLPSNKRLDHQVTGMMSGLIWYMFGIVGSFQNNAIPSWKY